MHALVLGAVFLRDVKFYCFPHSVRLALRQAARSVMKS